jgi:hypothetical protein
MFHVGQRVVCVDAKKRENWALRWLSAPTEGEVYTISAVGYFRPGCADLHIKLEELSNTGYGETVDVGYRANRFRPVKTTNIDVLLKLLEPVPA